MRLVRLGSSGTPDHNHASGPPGVSDVPYTRARRRWDTVYPLVLRRLGARTLLAALPVLACRSPQTSPRTDAAVDGGDHADGITSAGGSVRGPTLPGWQWMDDQRTGDGFSLDELKWRRSSDAGIVFLYAKDYAVSDDETISSLSARDWRTYYEPILHTVRAVEHRPVTFASRRAVAVTAQGAGPDGRAITVDEVYVPVHGHVLLTSATGPSGDVTAFASDIATWRAAVEFTALR
jgi:hypothetical protein